MRLFLLLLIAIGTVGCSTDTPNVNAKPDASSDGTPEPSPVTDSAAEEDTDIEPEVFVIDVRSKQEWDAGHVEQAAHIPHTEITDRIAEVTSQKDAKIVLYCAVGGRAGRAKTALEELGFTNVENAGGYDDVKQRFK